MIHPSIQYPVEEILAAAADLRRARRRAADSHRRRLRSEAQMTNLIIEERRSRDLADLAASVTHVIDQVPLQVVAEPRDRSVIVIRNLVDRRRWASYRPHKEGFRVFPSHFGDCGTTPYVDVQDAGAAEDVAIEFVLRGRLPA